MLQQSRVLVQFNLCVTHSKIKAIKIRCANNKLHHLNDVIARYTSANLHGTLHTLFV